MRMILPSATGERYEIVKQLRKLNCLVADWEHTDLIQLRDILQKEQEKAREKRIARPALSVEKRKEVGKALKEYREYLLIRKSGSQHKFFRGVKHGSNTSTG